MAKGDSTKTAILTEVNPALKQTIIDLSFAGTDQYKTGGFTIVPSDVGMSQIFAVIAVGAKGYQAAWSAPNLLLYRQTAATGALVEIPDNTNISTISPIRCLVIGTNA